MPIPTRRLSFREPRIGQQRKPPPDLDREATIPEVESSRPTKPRSNTVSSAATTSSSALTSAPTRSSNLSFHNQPTSGLPQPATTTAAQTDSGGNGGNGGDGTRAARRRSLLPQRSSWQKGSAGSVLSGRSQLQLQDSQLQRLRDGHTQEAQALAPKSPVLLARQVETSTPPSDQSQPHPPLSPSKLSRQATSPTRPQAVGMSRLERPGSANAPKLDASKTLDGPGPRAERPGSSSTTSSQLSRPQSGHIVTKAERPRSSSTITQGSRPQSKPTQRIERPERPGSGHTPKPDAPKPQPANATRLERSASLRQPIASRVTTTTNHSRHQSHLVGLTRGYTGVKHGEGNTSSTPSLKANKPQFSTFQQHFSPKKGPKTKPPIPPALTSPTTATATATATGTGNEPSTPTLPHIAALQVELLQLHLLHADSIRTRREWESSAEQQLHKQHKSVVSKYRTLLAQEQAAQRHINNLALNKLAADSKIHTNRSIRNNDNNNTNNNSSRGAYDFSQQIQILSRVIQDVATVTDIHGGRYISCVRTFEKWFEHVARVRQGRTGSRNPSRSQEPAINKYSDDDDADEGSNNNNDSDKRNHEYEFIDPLSFRWKEEVAALGVKLELCARELDCLDVDVDVVDGRMTDGQQAKGVDSDMCVHGEDGDAGYPQSSALVRAVKGHKMLLASMIDELEVMRAVEADVGKLERLWVRGAVDRLDSGGISAAAGGGGKEARRPVWVVA
ncbi:hypothetical protein ACJ73_07675 [Blastomyces percursus]|uniref:Uncharacterized protein n=1 Tax=Blastomyces percursus TaxID=1658174 RepID=A0A1J9QYR5_9EURO|nr:hypothetical protein ACJ73_07675 [Blastomyces percursus]